MENFLEVVSRISPWLLVSIVSVGALLVVFLVADHKRVKKQEKEQERIRREREQRIRSSGIYEVDRMTGEEFEIFLQFLLQTMGYDARITKTSGDYGADLVLSDGIKTIVVQAKRYTNKVGLKAVQEIVSAKSYYNADECWVITNSYFTAPAMKLGNMNDVLLIDRDELVEWMLEDDRGA